MTDLLKGLYKKYNIGNFTFGAIHDKLGDAYEEYITVILNSDKNIDLFNNSIGDKSLEFEIFTKIMEKNNVSASQKIKSINSTTKVPHRLSGGNPKTDIIATINFCDGSNKVITISSKQSTVKKVAMAEFDVNTICSEMNITNPRLKELMLKHQNDCSAKNFTAQEKKELTTLLKPIARDFVRWVITGCKDKNTSNPAFPKCMIKYELKKPLNKDKINIENGDFDLISFKVYTIEEYIDKIMLTKNGTPKSGGFGTGLSWTYATGSKNQKIQFKG